MYSDFHTRVTPQTSWWLTMRLHYRIASILAQSGALQLHQYMAIPVQARKLVCRSCAELPKQLQSESMSEWPFTLLPLRMPQNEASCNTTNIGGVWIPHADTIHALSPMATWKHNDLSVTRDPFQGARRAWQLLAAVYFLHLLEQGQGST